MCNTYFQILFRNVKTLRTLPLALLITVSQFATAPAQDSDEATVARIEEDWTLKISDPDPRIEGPQVTNVLSPRHGIDGLHAVFELNHQTLPSYRSGGMQLQAWYGSRPAAYKLSTIDGEFASTNEIITYTLRMSYADHEVTFEVVNGKSTTWGDFGNDGDLKLKLATYASDLGAYDPATSLEYSRVGFAPNRVNSFVLKEVRYYSADGTLLRTQAMTSTAN